MTSTSSLSDYSTSHGHSTASCPAGLPSSPPQSTIMSQVITDPVAGKTAPFLTQTGKANIATMEPTKTKERLRMNPPTCASPCGSHGSNKGIVGAKVKRDTTDERLLKKQPSPKNSPVQEASKSQYNSRPSPHKRSNVCKNEVDPLGLRCKRIRHLSVHGPPACRPRPGHSTRRGTRIFLSPPLTRQRDPAHVTHQRSAEQRLAHMLHAYASFPAHMKSTFLCHLLSQSNVDALQFVRETVSPVLKRDFLRSLPHELAFQVLDHLDVRSLCRAAAVCREWQSMIDCDATWRRRLEADNRYPIHAKCRYAYQDVGYTLKDLYRWCQVVRQNWHEGRARRLVFSGHTQRVVTCLQFDDEKIVAGLDDCLINIYDIRTGLHIRTLSGHKGGVWALKYVNDTLVSGSTDRTIRVWDISRGVCTHTFSGHTSTIRCLEIVLPVAVDGHRQPCKPLIVTGSRDCTLRVWELPDIQGDTYDGTGPNPWSLYTLTGHSHSVRAVAAHGHTVVSGSYDNTVCVWDLSNGQRRHRMLGHTQRVYTVVIDPLRQQCTSGSMDSTVRIWDLKTGASLRVLQGHSILVGLLGLSDEHLVSAAADSTLRVWSPETGTCKHILAGHRHAITCFQHDDDKVISGSEGGLKLWDIRTGRHIADLVTDVQNTWQVAFDRRRCIAAVKRNNKTFFEIMDFGVDGLEHTCMRGPSCRELCPHTIIP